MFSAVGGLHWHFLPEHHPWLDGTRVLTADPQRQRGTQ